eukprot:GEMP01006500.1.p1 GENE.GEMP01006500.1~~GEMP01006500.1.p1  ORF type:complete len:595 (+),score=119.05 GEMP01006500.1:282-2066(+)
MEFEKADDKLLRAQPNNVPLSSAYSIFEIGTERDITRGPRVDRSCRDCICFVIFMLAFAFFLGISAAGYAEGKPEEVLDIYIHPKDHDGEVCPPTYPYIFYPVSPLQGSILPNMTMIGACTKQCPTATQHAICQAKDLALCSSKAISKPTIKIGKYCFPNHFHYQFNFGAAVVNIREAWPVMLLCFFTTIVVGFLFLAVLETCTFIIVWGVLLSFIGGIVAAGTYTYMHVEEIHEDHGWRHWNILAFSYTSWGVAAALTILTVCYCKTLRTAIALLETAAEFLIDVKSQMVQPVLFALVHVLFSAAWVVTFAYVMTINVKYGDEVCVPRHDLGQLGKGKQYLVPADNPFCVEWSSSAEIAIGVFMVFMLLWINGMISALSHFTTAYAAGVWYHLGSFAMGAFVCTICKILQILFCWVRWLTKKTEGVNPNPVSKVFLACGDCLCTSCLKSIVFYVTDQAYIQAALLGTGFCESARAASAITVRHPLRAALASNLSDMLELCGAALITFCSVALGFFLLNNSNMVSEVDDVVPPLVLIGLVGATIGLTMMHPYSRATMTIMQCFFADEEMSKNMGHSSARHIPGTLRGFLRNNEE